MHQDPVRFKNLVHDRYRDIYIYIYMYVCKLAGDRSLYGCRVNKQLKLTAHKERFLGNSKEPHL